MITKKFQNLSCSWENFHCENMERTILDKRKCFLCKKTAKPLFRFPNDVNRYVAYYFCVFFKINLFKCILFMLVINLVHIFFVAWKIKNCWKSSDSQMLMPLNDMMRLQADLWNKVTWFSQQLVVLESSKISIYSFWNVDHLN